MNSGLYTAYSGLRANADMLEVLANNLANVNTTGFKADEAFFRVFNHALAESTATPLDRVINDSSVVQGTAIDFRPGSITRTGRDLDVALEGQGFLVVETPWGSRYTRNGHLKIDGQGHLMMPEGFRVIGKGGPITLPPGQVTISQTGEIQVNGSIVDTIKVVDFKDKTQLEKTGSSLFATRHAGVTEEEAKGVELRQGSLELSNVNPVRQTMLMITMMRQFEGLQKNINMVMNNLNDKSINQVGRSVV